MTTDPNARLIRSRAIEATIWGMPAVSMAAFRKSLVRDLGAGAGDIVYFSDLALPRHELLTANNQTPYVLTFLDLRDGPMVLDVPAASATTVLLGSAIDTWQVPLVDIGPAGEDAGQGGRYLFLPPGDGQDAPEGFLGVPSPTFFVHVALRPISIGAGTLADAVAYAQRLRAYPLAEADNPAPNRYVDAFPKAWHGLPSFDVTVLRDLAEVVEIEPAQPKDAAMLGMLASIDIERGRPFEPTPEREAVLTSAVAEAVELMNDYFLHDTFVPHWPDRHWMALKPEDTHGFSFYGDGRLDYDRRAGGFALWATFAPKVLGTPGKLPGSYYLMCFADSTGEPFRGDRHYRLRMPADTPARDFWSIVVYEVGTNAFIHVPQDKVSVSSYDRSALAANADGSVDVHIGPEAPQGLEANWIPTGGRDFWLMCRFYGPEAPLFDKSWSMNDAERVG